MSQKKEVLTRQCHNCTKKFEMTAKEIKEHYEDCGIDQRRTQVLTQQEADILLSRGCIIKASL